jgi:hypothetical protein
MIADEKSSAEPMTAATGEIAMRAVLAKRKRLKTTRSGIAARIDRASSYHP